MVTILELRSMILKSQTIVEKIDPYDEANLRMLIEDVIEKSHTISTLSDLDDVNMTGELSDGDVLTFDKHDEKWLPKQVDYTIDRKSVVCGVRRVIRW